YVFRATVTDNRDATAYKDITVIVKDDTKTTPSPPPPPPNAAPVAKAGSDITITLPQDYVTLNGETSEDTDGTITKYAWTYIDGPAAYNIADATAAKTSVTGLQQGNYRFRLQVTDNDGDSNADTVAIKVN